MIPGEQRPMPNDTSPPRNAYPWYVTGSSLWMAGMSLQGFLFTWLLVGILEMPADAAGIARSLAEFPPLIVLFLGGLIGDRIDARRYLSWMHITMSIPPLIIAMVFELGALTYWWVVAFGVAMASVQALSDPARQAVISRVARMDIQRAVTLMTIVTTGVGMLGFYLGGRLETWGLATVLGIQAALFFVGTFAVRQLPPLPVTSERRAALADGLRAMWKARLVRNIILLSFFSSLFNAGAYIIAIPYIAKEVYLGDAAFLAQVMIVFTIGSISSNVLLFLFMPLRHPGRLFIYTQLVRMAVLAALWVKPDLWLFYVLMLAWGLNMGIGTTVVRTTVQELAPEKHRAQILSVLIFSFMVSSPISSILLGFVIAGFSPLDALLPGVVTSLIIFVLAIGWSGLWRYEARQSA